MRHLAVFGGFTTAILVWSAAGIFGQQNSESGLDWLLTDDEANEAWYVSTAHSRLTYTDELDGRSSAELILKHHAFKEKNLSFEVNSDAGSLKVKLARIILDLPLSRTKTRISFRGGDDPGVWIDDKEYMPGKGKWIKIYLDDDTPTLRFSFDKPKHLNVIVSINATRQTPARTGSTASRTTTGVDAIAEVKHGVFQVITYDENNKPLGKGSAFLVDQKGILVTNFHVIHGASSAGVKYAWGGNEIKAKLRHVIPKYDLAFLSIDTSQIRAPHVAPPPAALRVSSRGAQPGADAWAVGYPLGVGYTVTKGVVNGLRTFNQLPSLYRKGSSYDPSSKWLQTDCTINPGNSGGPLVNSRGEVIGVNTWSLLVGDNMYFALSAAHLISELAILPATDLGFAAAKEKHGERQSIWSYIPEHIDPYKPARPSSQLQIRNASASLRNHVLVTCPTCKGAGHVIRSKKIGMKTEGSYRTPIYRDYKETCSRCKGKKQYLNNEKVIARICDNATKAVASANQEHPNSTDALQYAYDALLDQIARNTTVLNICSDRARAILARDTVPSGTPLVTEAFLVGSIRHPQGNDDLKLLITIPTQHLLLFTNGILEDDLEKGSVLVGGIITDKRANDRGDIIAVVQNGYLIKTPTMSTSRISR